MPYLETEKAVRWHYSIQGDGPCLILIHGWASSAKVFSQQAEYFSKDYQVVSVDLPGHGLSSWQPVNLQDMAEDVLCLARHLGHSTTMIMGSSLGGMVGLECARVKRSMVKKLVMVGSLPRFLKTQQQPLGLSPQEMNRLQKQLQDKYPGILDIFFRSLFTFEERETQKFQWIHQFRKSENVPHQKALEHFLKLLSESDLTSFLLKADIPVLLITGDRDYICPPESVGFLKSMMPQAQCHIMEKSGHFPFIIYAREFNKKVEEFLR